MKPLPYYQTKPNDPIPLFKNLPGKLHSKNISIKCTANGAFNFIPYQTTFFEISIKGTFNDFMTLKSSKTEKVYLSIDNLNQEIEIIITNFYEETEFGETTGIVKALPSKSPVFVGDLTVPIKTYIIYFANFPYLEDSKIETDNFELKLNKHKDINHFIKTLTRGFGITHTGEFISKKSDFEKNYILNTLDCFFYFFSFVFGFEVGPVLAVGIDNNDSKKWEIWGGREVDAFPWEYIPSWFFQKDSDFTKIFPTFWKYWCDEEWNQIIRTTIFWYLKSNLQKPGLRGSIILTQSALEHLCWAFTVIEKKLLDKDAFNKLTAGQQIKLVLATLDLPLEIPESLTALKKFAKSNTNLNGISENGPLTFCEIRNIIIHPDLKRKSLLKENLLRETWLLGQWYLELILLKLFKYQGKYRNRINLMEQTRKIEKFPS